MNSAGGSNELPRANPEELGFSSQRLGKLTAVIQQYIDEGKIQGAVMGVGRYGKVAYLEAQGLKDVQTGEPMSLDSVFQMWSSTKPVLGVAAMMMIEEGRFSPSDPVERYIPEFKDMQVAVLADPADEDVSPELIYNQEVPAHRLVPAQRPVTINDMLTHRSGLASWGLGMAVADWQWDNESLASWIPKLAEIPLDFQPGSRWTYSPLDGLDVVARIIEIVSGMPFDEFVQQRILDPLDMKDTHWVVPAEKKHRQVVVTDFAGKSLERTSDRYFSGSVGLHSTVRDYLHFEQMLLNGGSLFGRQLLKPKSVAEMTRNQVGDMYKGKGVVEGLGFGYTVSMTLDPEKAANFRSTGAAGWAGAMGTVSWFEPEHELTAVMLVQQPTENLHNHLTEAIHQAFED